MVTLILIVLVFNIFFKIKYQPGESRKQSQNNQNQSYHCSTIKALPKSRRCISSVINGINGCKSFNESPNRWHNIILTFSSVLFFDNSMYWSAKSCQIKS